MPTSLATANPDLHEHIRSLLLAAKSQVRQTVNTAMVQTYWHIGRLIVEDEQGGKSTRLMASRCCLNSPRG